MSLNRIFLHQFFGQLIPIPINLSRQLDVIGFENIQFFLRLLLGSFWNENSPIGFKTVFLQDVSDRTIQGIRAFDVIERDKYLVSEVH